MQREYKRRDQHRRSLSRFTILLTGICCLVMAWTVSSVSANAKSKLKINISKKTLSVGKSQVLKAKGSKSRVRWKVISGRKVVKLSAKKKKSVKVTARKAGTAKIQAKAGKKKCFCRIKVKKKSSKASKEFGSKVSMKVGDRLTLELAGNPKDVRWSLSGDNHLLHAKKIGNKKIELLGLNSGKITVIAKFGSERKKCVVTVKEKYSYSITPLLPPFNEYFYLKTEDPDPYDLKFVDESSIYTENVKDKNKLYIKPSEISFCDVKYTNKDYLRVKDGYICSGDAYFYGDGGELKMQRCVVMDRTGSYGAYQKADKGLCIYEDSSVKITCPSVKNYIQYLVDSYGGEGSFFEQLDAVQNELDHRAIYPRSVLDVSRKNQATPYPFLASSPYPELDLNEHVEMYEYMEGGLLTQSIYPYVLDSLGVPGVMASVAKRIDPSCTIESGDAHWEIVVTKDGKSRSYGGAGGGGYDPLFSNLASKDFKFDGSSSDFAFQATLDSLEKRLVEYGKLAYDTAREYHDLLSGNTFQKTIGKGSWIRIGMEPYWSGNTPPKAYAYMTIFHGGNIIEPCSDAWVDGRYISKHEVYVPGEKFEEHPQATIVLRDQNYMTQNGDAKTGDIVYRYFSDSDTWRAYNTYTDSRSYTVGMELPEQFILTREQVGQMELDYNTNVPPDHGLIYDSTQYPGTAF